MPAQIDYAVDDPMRNQEWVDAVATSVRAAGGALDVYDYPGSGHLFTDASLPAEHDPLATELLFERVLAFCADPPRG